MTSTQEQSLEIIGWKVLLENVAGLSSRWQHNLAYIQPLCQNFGKWVAATAPAVQEEELQEYTIHIMWHKRFKVNQCIFDFAVDVHKLDFCCCPVHDAQLTVAL